MLVSCDGELTTFQGNLFHFEAALIREQFPELAFFLDPRGEWLEKGGARDRGRDPQYPQSSEPASNEFWEQVRGSQSARIPLALAALAQLSGGKGSQCSRCTGPAEAGPAHKEVCRDEDSNGQREELGWDRWSVLFPWLRASAQPGLGKTSWALSKPCL